MDWFTIIEELRLKFPDVDKHIRTLEKDTVVAHTGNTLIRAPGGDLVRARTPYMLCWRKEEGNYYTSTVNLKDGYIRALQRDSKTGKICQTPFDEPKDEWTRQMVLEATGYIENSEAGDRFYFVITSQGLVNIIFKTNISNNPI